MQVDISETCEQINGEMPYPSNFDRSHDFSVVLDYKRGTRVSLPANLLNMTGRPVTYPVSVCYDYFRD